MTNEPDQQPQRSMRFRCENFIIEKVISVAEDNREDCYVIPPDAAGIIALTDDGKFVLLREYRRASGRMEWYIPAGRKKEEDASLVETARRELAEEAKLGATSLEFFMIEPPKAAWYKHEKHFFVAKGLYDFALDTGDEAVPPEVHLKTSQEVYQLLDDGEITGDIAAVLYRFLRLNDFADNRQHINGHAHPSAETNVLTDAPKP